LEDKILLSLIYKEDSM